MKCSNATCGWTFDGHCNFCQDCAAPMDDQTRSKIVLCPGKLDNNCLCQAVLRETQKFCQECGTKVNTKLFIKKQTVLHCRGTLRDGSVCQTVMTPSQNFCHECGVKVNQNLAKRGGTERCSGCKLVLEYGASVCSKCGTENTVRGVKRSRSVANQLSVVSAKSSTAVTQTSSTVGKLSAVVGKLSAAVSKSSLAVGKPITVVRKPRAVRKTSRSLVKPGKLNRNKASPTRSTRHTASGKENAAVPSTCHSVGKDTDLAFPVSVKKDRSIFESMDVDVHAPDQDVSPMSVSTDSDINATGPASNHIQGKAAHRNIKAASTKDGKTSSNVMLYCYPCALAFTSEYHFDRHTKFRHSMPKFEKDDHPPVEQTVSLEIKEKWKSTEEPECESPEKDEHEEVGLKKKRVYKQHIFECEICGKIMKHSMSFKAHMNQHQGVRPYSCQFCDATFADGNTLSKHRKRHTGKKAFTCKLCPKTFYQTSGLRLHMRSHTQDRKFACQYCEKRFLQKQHLSKHVKHIHTKERNHNCDVCGKGYYDKYQLNAHKKIHDDIRAYKCSECDLAFVDGSNLKAHLRVHSGETPYCCITCNKKFARSMDLKTHLSVHREAKYKCSLCGVHCRTELGIKSHVLQHKNIKPFGCEYCDRKYMCNGSLQDHRKKRHLVEIKAEQGIDDVKGNLSLVSAN